MNQSRNAVEAARELNICAQDQREAGPRGRESSLGHQHRLHSSNTEIPHKSTQYHLSSKWENPPLPVARHSSESSGYNPRIGNPQLLYRQGYPVHGDNDHNPPPAFASPPHQNSNLLGYGNIPAEPAHPSQPNASRPARSEQHHHPMNQGDPLHPLSGALTSRLVPTEKELGPARKIGRTDVSQTLHKTRENSAQPVHSAIHEYAGRGIDKTSIDPKAHAVICTLDVLCNRKLSGMIQDDFIVIETLLFESGKVYAVEHIAKAPQCIPKTPSLLVEIVKLLRNGV
ncbi:hypothetical protein EMPG_14992 [Blastomyces silverae]|uniref:Uncharacterized protein n=1 Tax=Blastomyces silverae TaxID=2060906 RepID=A0A0H1BDQ5_9EURO|nr:hypothetical protein EMPG_14992 [Blastomyces silverae]